MLEKNEVISPGMAHLSFFLLQTFSPEIYTNDKYTQITIHKQPVKY